MKNTTKYSNNARTSLSASITSSQTTIPVLTVAGFPAISVSTDEFFITIDNSVNIEIVKVGGISGSSFINCVRGQEGTTPFAFGSGTSVENRLTAGNITKFARLEDRLRDVGTLEDLLAPANSNGNSVLCSSLDAGGMPIVGMVAGTKWKFLNYPDLIRTGTAGAGATATQISITNIGNYLIDTTPKMYVIQFTSGAHVGKCRFITTITTNTIAWATSLGSAPGTSDSFELYRCVSSWKAPMGVNSDRVFYENDQNVWFDYTIPAGRNASSAGPITVNPGITVTVPIGAAWSIV